MFSRIIFILLVLAKAIPCNSSCTEKDVVIVGAGYAGVAAAREAEKYAQKTGNPIEYVILEADYPDIGPSGPLLRPRCGGRALGQHWIAGAEGNYLFEWLWASGLPLSFNYETQKWSDYLVCTQSGPGKNEICNELKQNIVNKARMDWRNAYDCLQTEINKFKAEQRNDASIVQVLQECGWNPNQNSEEQYIREIFSFYDTDYEFAEDNSVTSLFNYPLWAYSDFQDKDIFIPDPLNGKAIVDGLIDAIGNVDGIPSIRHKILPRRVGQIKWGETSVDYPVVISTTDTQNGGSEEYCAKKVLVTVSQGVLNKNHMDRLGLFSPTHPRMSVMQELFGTDGMAQYKELQVQFKDHFWGDLQFIFLPKDNDLCRIWQSYDPGFGDFFPGSNVVTCALVTDQWETVKASYSTTSGELDAAKVHDNLIVPLLMAFGVERARCSKAEDMSEWDPTSPASEIAGDCRFRIPEDENPLWQGSYSHFKVQHGSKDSAITDMFMEYIAPAEVDTSTCDPSSYQQAVSACCPSLDYCQVHLAGEDCCDRHAGWAHGAYFSGIREMNFIIEELFQAGVLTQVNPHPTPQFCEQAPSGGYGNPFLRPPKAG